MFGTISVALAYFLATSVSAESNCKVPDAVSNLKAENTTPTATNLSWQPPAFTECLDHYKITYCSYLGDKCTNKTIVLPLNTTNYEVTELKPCTSNAIQLYAVGKDGRETYTKMLLYTGSGNPPKVEKINLNYVGAINITIIWERPSGYRDDCYPGYKVCYSAKGDNKEACSYASTESFTMLSAIPRPPCTEYNFSVETVDGNFAADSKTSAKTYVSVFTVPQMPNVTVAVNNHTAHATWKTPDTLSMTCAASYVVNNSRMTGRPYHEVLTTVSSQTLPLNVTEATITGLNSCTNNQIFFHLVGHNGYSSYIDVVVPDPDSDIPVPTGVRVYRESDDIILYYYNRLNDCVNSYRACWLTNGEAEICRYGTVTSTINRFYNLHLKSYTNYTLHVTALGSGGRHCENFTTTFYSGPQDLASVTAHENTSEQTINLSWVNPSNNHLFVDYIEVMSTRERDRETTTLKLPNNATTITFADIIPCSEYRFKLYAVKTGVTPDSHVTIHYKTSCSTLLQ